MKRTYAFMIAGSMLMSGGLLSCTGDNTTGVDTETTANEVDGRLNDPAGGPVTNDNISPLDTANAGTGANTDDGMNTGDGMNKGDGMNNGNNNITGPDTARTNVPRTDNGF